MKLYEKHIEVYAAELERAIAQKVRQNITINDYFYSFSLEVVLELAFYKSFGMLSGQKWHYSAELLHAGLALVGPFSPVPWPVRIAFDIPIIRIVRDFQAMEAWRAKRMDERIEVRKLCKI